MKERPIIFSGPSVRAIQQGRKTQTRRIIKPVRGFERHNICKPDMAADPWAVWWHGDETDRVGCLQECPYGKPGDRLWVREGWSTSALGVYPCPSVWYRADFDQHDDPAKNREHTCPKEYQDPHSYNFGHYADCFACAGTRETPFWWHSSLHMFRKFARLLLEITEVRVQPVQEIDEADAQREGWAFEGLKPNQSYDPVVMDTARQWYRSEWDRLNAKRGFPWSDNPWVWALSFKRITEVPHV